MKDLTKGSVAGHLLSMAAPTAAGMLLQPLYHFVDLYFVAGLGDAAVAGVSAAANVMLMIVALTQVLGVGTVTLISHAVGRKDQQDANLIFNQSPPRSCKPFSISLGCGSGCVCSLARRR